VGSLFPLLTAFKFKKNTLNPVIISTFYSSGNGPSVSPEKDFVDSPYKSELNVYK
jgi:hypothetical protein